MQYMGGKSRIARSIAEIINEIPRRKIKNCQTHCSDNHAGCGGDCFVSLFCGSCAVESKVQGFSRKLLNDRHEYLIAMLQGVQQGYNLPEHITLEQYRYIRENKDADPVLAGFVGFGCSFGGKWFGGYARNKTGTNYAEQSKRSLLKDIRGRLAIVYNGETVTSKTNASNPQVGGPCHTLGATGAGRAVVIENHAKAFSFDSLASNSMKSTNPHSGCREVGVSKTLDATRPDPAKNQGGIAIVQLAVENHPQDSRVKINENGVVQTLSGQMGTGGGNVPLILENK